MGGIHHTSKIFAGKVWKKFLSEHFKNFAQVQCEFQGGQT